MKKYLVSVYHAEGADYAPPAEEIQQIMSGVEAFNTELRSTGGVGVRRWASSLEHGHSGAARGR
jgi:hypothetical protein